MLTAARPPEGADGAGSEWTAAPDPELIESGYRPPGLLRRLSDVVQHRQLLWNLTRREVKVRHKNSLLGFAWNLMNPLLYLVIFSLVFTFILPSGSIPRYALNLLAGLLVYDLFAAGVTGATSSVVANSHLVQKIWFPREVLPVAAVAANLVPFLSRLVILGIGLALFRQSPEWSMIWLLIPALAITLVMAVGLGLLLAAANVFFRDVQHFLELALLALFWFTPIVYVYDFAGNAIRDRLGVGAERLAMLNPLTPLTTTFQRVLYNPTNFGPEQQESFTLLLRPSTWYLQNLAISAVTALVLLFLGLRVFARLEGSFAERL
ncbi:MAG: ABC transporter permease [Actinomycetota bacterium]